MNARLFSSTLICMDCGNPDKFIRPFYGNFLVRDFKESVEYISTDDFQGISNDWLCYKCKSHNIMSIENNNELLRVRHLHTDNNEQWHKHILDESKRNKKIGKQIMVDNL